MDTEIENRIEELIDQKLDEPEEEVNRKKLKREIIDELKQDDKVELDAELSRRSFLKTLGLGAGGLAFSSLAASANWALWQPQRLGTSEIDADTVDGKNSSSLMQTPSGYSDVTSSRSLGTQYSNDTGRPILVIVIESSSYGDKVELYVDGSLVAQDGVSNDSYDPCVQGIVPDGSTYEARGGGLRNWVELQM